MYLSHAVSVLCLQSQSAEVERRLLVAGQPVLQQVLPELEVKLVSGLLVPDEKNATLMSGILRAIALFQIFGNDANKYSQKKRNVADKEFDPEEKDEGGRRHFLPAFRSNFTNFGVVVHKEELVI